MKPKELSRKNPSHSSFSVSKLVLPHFLNVWHYHEEFELVYIQKSVGTKFIGDSIKKFGPGDLVLIGSNLPHLWLNDKKYFGNNELMAAVSWSLYFHPSCLGEGFFHLPEMVKVEKMLKEARVGLEINGKNKWKIIKAITSIKNSDDINKIKKFLDILKWIADDPEKKKLSSPSFVDSYTNMPGTGSRLDVVYEYVFNNFKNDICLEQIASLANMNPSSFSRYFRQVTNKTFTTFLNEVRIGYACKQIVEQKYMNIAQIGFASGYNNLSNFNKQFKNMTDKTPTEYYNSHIGARS